MVLHDLTNKSCKIELEQEEGNRIINVRSQIEQLKVDL
jgi:hypothetical protein